jgi:hypothetical protein
MWATLRLIFPSSMGRFALIYGLAILFDRTS